MIGAKDIRKAIEAKDDDALAEALEAFVCACVDDEDPDEDDEDAPKRGLGKLKIAFGK